MSYCLQGEGNNARREDKDGNLLLPLSSYQSSPEEAAWATLEYKAQRENKESEGRHGAFMCQRREKHRVKQSQQQGLQQEGIQWGKAEMWAGTSDESLVAGAC